MKKYLILLSAAAVGLTSCLLNVDDKFDESASQRIETAMNEYDQLLRSSGGGWLVEYWPEAGMQYGGYNLYFKFDEGEIATVGSEIFPDSLSQGLYSIKGDRGPTLNFDSYNNLFHYFSDPSLPVGGGAGYGFEGDYAFVLMDGDESGITLKGKKTGNTIRMTPFTGITDWAGYAEQIQYIYNHGTSPYYMLVVHGQEYEMTRASRVFTIFDGGREIRAPYIVTPEGLKFYEPVVIDGVPYQEFILDEGAQMYNATNKGASIYMIFVPMNEVFLEASKWTFSTYSQKLEDVFAEAFNSLYNKSGYWPYIVYLGENTVTNYQGVGIFFLVSNRASYFYAGYTLEFIPVPGSPDLLEITYDEKTFGGGSWSPFEEYLSPLAQYIADHSPYRLIPPDFEADVSTLRFESTVDPEIYFDVSK